MHPLTRIKQPIEREYDDFVKLFNQAFTHTDELLSSALSHLSQRGGKHMRPLLTLLMARHYGQVSSVTLNAAIGLELLHTASLVHDDVVDESPERRGQASLNASYNNKVAVLVGDYILSTALLHVSATGDARIVRNLSQLGQTLAAGEILQLENVQRMDFSEQRYYDVIRKKTASLFESCVVLGAMSAGAPDSQLQRVAQFGDSVGMMFQIRDDIFDYSDSTEIGKPTGNDMAEGKLTLPVLHALNQAPLDSMLTLARKVKARTVNADEIAVLVDFAKQQGGIDYARQCMHRYYQQALAFVDETVENSSLRTALTAYLDYVVERTK